jgi:hypothetical protein
VDTPDRVKRDAVESHRVARLRIGLLSLYNGYRFKMDLGTFRALDLTLFNDCMVVLTMDWQPDKEAHCYFPDGSLAFEDIAKRWGIKDEG